jgi:hypothetical protein
MKPYTAEYEPAIIGLEPGYYYRCYCGGQLAFEGWTRGKMRDAEEDVRRSIAEREALRGAQ